VEQHREWIEREAIPALAKKDTAAANALGAALAGKEPPPPKSKRELQKELDAALREAGGKLAAAEGNAAKERAVLEEAYRTYCSVRAAQGEVIPGAYFTHLLGDQKWKTKVDQATFVRWMDLAVAVANED